MGLCSDWQSKASWIFQSTHPVWDGTSETRGDEMSVPISIHPSRVGWDPSMRIWFRSSPISIHPSRVGWDYPPGFHIYRASQFQSTHPVWDGTRLIIDYSMTWGISIHPSRVGWDLQRDLDVFVKRIFQSTHPVWDGTRIDSCIAVAFVISIHPSRVGWDFQSPEILLM